MSIKEISDELIEDLVNKISSYVKTYETSLIDLKRQALELIESKDAEIARLNDDILELQYRLDNPEDVSEKDTTS